MCFDARVKKALVNSSISGGGGVESGVRGVMVELGTGRGLSVTVTNESAAARL
jgi:hypothetical protein